MSDKDQESLADFFNRALLCTSEPVGEGQTLYTFTTRAAQVEHCKAPKTGESYIAFHADAEQRLALGQAQVRCWSCGRYQWPDHGCPLFKETLAELAALGPPQRLRFTAPRCCLTCAFAKPVESAEGDLGVQCQRPKGPTHGSIVDAALAVCEGWRLDPCHEAPLKEAQEELNSYDDAVRPRGADDGDKSDVRAGSGADPEAG